MLIKRLTFLIFIISNTAYAYNFSGGEITIPQGFEKPMTRTLGGGATTTSFKYPHTKDKATILQITSWTPDQKMPPLTLEGRKEANISYLLHFLSGVEERRTDFSRGKIEFITISNVPTARIMWSGKSEGKSLYGVMYSFIHNSNIYSLHTQGFASISTPTINLSADAIEGIQLKR